MSTLLSLLILVAVVMVIFWVINEIGLAHPFSTILKLVVGILAIAKLLQLAGLSF